MRTSHLSLIVLNGFLAVSAVAGGIGLLGGGLVFPLEWLAGTPFSSYTIPGLVLLVIVGGSALVATTWLLRRHRWGILAAGVAGIMIMAFEMVEVLVVGSEPGLMRNLQLFYFFLGLLITVLASRAWLTAHRLNLKAV